jgi:uncharacterized membrane protein YphA (DoxX/SURF4 family)
MARTVSESKRAEGTGGRPGPAREDSLASRSRFSSVSEGKNGTQHGQGSEMKQSGGWVVPALEASRAVALMRLTMGALFIWVFFENLGKHLYSPGRYAGLIQFYIQKGAAPAFWKSIMAATAAHASIAAPLQGLTEIAFGVLLVLGLFSRPVALAAFAFLTSLWVSEWGTAWIWELLVPMMVCLTLALAPSGRAWGLDAWLKRRFPRYPFA